MAVISLVLLAKTAFACDLTAPTVTTWACDDYYGIGHQWSCFNVTALSNAPFIKPTSFADLQSFLWYYSVREAGSRVEISLNPPNQTKPGTITFSQKQLADNCWQASYTIQGVKDFPNIPSACEAARPEGYPLPPDCVKRLNTSFTAESTGWFIKDSAGRVSGNVDGAPCIAQGPPNNVAYRGALCENE